MTVAEALNGNEMADTQLCRLSQDAGTVRQRQPHVVMVPYPLQGHISPLMQLSRVLASKGIRVTFITTQFNVNQMIKSCPKLRQELPENIHLVGIADGLPPEHDRNPFKPESLLDLMEGGIPSNTAKAVTELANSSHPVTCLVHDSFLLWAHDIATNLKIPRVPFWPNSITCFACSYAADNIAAAFPGLDPFDHKTYEEPNANVILDGIIPGVPSILAGELPLKMFTPSLQDWMRYQLAEQKAGLASAHAVICNSSPVLETTDALAATTLHEDLSATLPVKLYPIGPLFEACRYLAGTEVSLWEPEDECLQWLDKQEVGSVVYISLGSVALVAEEELREIGKGLAASGKCFLWVVKTWASEKDAEKLVGDEVLQIVKDGRGKIAKWVPQIRVLAHEAVGAFVSHSGWNSTLESLSYGVPMLCLPLMMDQVTNSWLVSHQLSHGFRLYPEKEGGLSSTIETGIKRIMGGGNGRRRLAASGSPALDALVENITKL